MCLRLLLLVALLPSSSSVTPATPIQDVTMDGFRNSLHLSEGGTTASPNGGTEVLQHVEKDCMLKVEGKTRAKKRLFSWYE